MRDEEWMDRPGVPAEELRRALAYIRWINWVLGYNRATRGRVEAWAKTWGAGERVTVLDVATGSGDVPADLIRWNAGRYGVKFVGLDLHSVTIDQARREVRDPAFVAVRGDAMALPLEDGSVDYAMTSMFLHHLSDVQVVAVLREMWRVSRRGVMAADLVRTRGALAGVWLLSRFSSPMIRHDAVVSVRQAFTGEEILELCQAAGWQKADLRRHRNHRFTVVANKGL